MQIIADVTQRKIMTTSQPLNAGAMGAAVVAMVGHGTLNDFGEIGKMIQVRDTFHPRIKFSKLYRKSIKPIEVSIII